MNGKTKKHDDNIMVREEDREIINGLLDQHNYLINKFVWEAATNAVCSREDLYQEGCLAVVRAYYSYDDNKGASLSTWIYHCVKDAILEYQKQNLGFLSGGQYLYNAMKKAGPDATPEELMKMGIGKKTALAAVYFNLKPAQYGAALNLADPKAQKQLEEIESYDMDYHDYLTEKEIFAIENYFGLNDHERMTMKEIGECVGKSRKAVSYLINQAIVKLRYAYEIEGR